LNIFLCNSWKMEKKNIEFNYLHSLQSLIHVHREHFANWEGTQEW